MLMTSVFIVYLHLSPVFLIFSFYLFPYPLISLVPSPPPLSLPPFTPHSSLTPPPLPMHMFSCDVTVSLSVCSLATTTMSCVPSFIPQRTLWHLLLSTSPFGYGTSRVLYSSLNFLHSTVYFTEHMCTPLCVSFLSTSLYVMVFTHYYNKY